MKLKIIVLVLLFGGCNTGGSGEKSEVLPVGGGYSSNTEGYLDTTEFLKEYRRLK